MDQYCCQEGQRFVSKGPSSIDELEVQSEAGGTRRMLFAPLGNSPISPKLALVGITPGSQVEKFRRFLQTNDVAASARLAAFSGAEKSIRELLDAHGFLRALGISYAGSVNDCPEIFTTSLVKCCMTVNGSYKYKAPDIKASPMAIRCVTNRFIADIERYDTLSHVAIFGAPGWEALKTISIGGLTVLERLQARGLTVLNFPHFAQNFQQRTIFQLEPDQDEVFLQRKPGYLRYYSGAIAMRSGVIRERDRLRSLLPSSRGS